MSDSVLAPINEEDFWAGREDAWEYFELGKPVPQPHFEDGSDDYALGVWCGIGEVEAWMEGYRAATGRPQACLALYEQLIDGIGVTEFWIDGCWAAFSCSDVKYLGKTRQT